MVAIIIFFFRLPTLSPSPSLYFFFPLQLSTTHSIELSVCLLLLDPSVFRLRAICMPPPTRPICLSSLHHPLKPPTLAICPPPILAICPPPTQATHSRILLRDRSNREKRGCEIYRKVKKRRSCVKSQEESRRGAVSIPVSRRRGAVSRRVKKRSCVIKVDHISNIFCS